MASFEFAAAPAAHSQQEQGRGGDGITSLLTNLDSDMIPKLTSL
jgi:hypothetical protein